MKGDSVHLTGGARQDRPGHHRRERPARDRARDGCKASPAIFWNDLSDPQAATDTAEQE